MNQIRADLKSDLVPLSLIPITTHVSSGEIILHTTAHTFSPGAYNVAAGTADGYVLVINTHTKALLRFHTVSRAPITDLLYISQSTILVGDAAGSVYTVNADTGVVANVDLGVDQIQPENHSPVLTTRFYSILDTDTRYICVSRADGHAAVLAPAPAPAPAPTLVLPLTQLSTGTRTLTFLIPGALVHCTGSVMHTLPLVHGVLGAGTTCPSGLGSDACFADAVWCPETGCAAVAVDKQLLLCGRDGVVVRSVSLEEAGNEFECLAPANSFPGVGVVYINGEEMLMVQTNSWLLTISLLNGAVVSTNRVDSGLSSVNDPIIRTTQKLAQPRPIATANMVDGAPMVATLHWLTVASNWLDGIVAAVEGRVESIRASQETSQVSLIVICTQPHPTDISRLVPGFITLDRCSSYHERDDEIDEELLDRYPPPKDEPMDDLESKRVSSVKYGHTLAEDEPLSLHLPTNEFYDSYVQPLVSVTSPVIQNFVTTGILFEMAANHYLGDPLPEPDDIKADPCIQIMIENSSNDEE